MSNIFKLLPLDEVSLCVRRLPPTVIKLDFEMRCRSLARPVVRYYDRRRRRRRRPGCFFFHRELYLIDNDSSFRSNLFHTLTRTQKSHHIQPGSEIPPARFCAHVSNRDYCVIATFTLLMRGKNFSEETGEPRSAVFDLRGSLRSSPILQTRYLSERVLAGLKSPE